MQPNQWQQPQQFGFNSGFQGYGQQQQRPNMLGAQPTGFPGAQQQRPMATGMPMQQTGMPGGMGGMGGMSGMGGMGGMSGMGGGAGAGTGAAGAGGAGNYSFLSAPPAAGSFGPQRSSFSSQGGMMPQATGFSGGGMGAQPTGMGGMMSQPTGMGGGLMSQPTGMGGLRAQPTGMHDPRLASMVQSFMPSNMAQPFSASGVPQFNQAQSQPLTQTFQSLLNNPSVKTPKVPWTLTRQEKKDYDQIFRAWDTRGDGFITGEMAREVFGQSGLSQDDLMKIWNLSDVDNRGKLNLPEFHVAMGLIYRALNGNEIPDKLPEELVPASMRDIDSTVNFMKDLLKHESSTRSDTSSPVGYGAPITTSGASAKDAKVYKHDDSRPAGGYKSSARHLDRKTVRYAGEDSGAEISDLRRQLENASGMLDSSTAENSRKTEEDEILEQEVDDIKRRVTRIKEDIDYVSKGRRTADKDEERRKLEREMLYLMHEKLPELERRQERRAEEKRMEERAGIRARDRRNETHGRYDDRDRDHDWLRGTYDRDRERDRSRDRDRDRDYGRSDRDRYNDRDRDGRDYRDSRDRYDDRDRDRYDDRRRGSEYRQDSRDRGSSRYDSRDDRDRYDRDDRNDRGPSPRPSSPKKSEPAAPAPKKEPPKPATKSLASMTPEERKAYLKEQAQRKIQERMRALGVEPSPSTTPEPAVDTSVEDRLAQERKEAEERARAADAEQAAREEARKARLASARGEAPAAPAPPAPAAKKEPPKPPPAPPAVAKKGPPPAPTPRQGKVPPPAPSPRHAPPAPRAPPAPPAEDPEEAELRAQEEARQKAIQERRERLKRLQEEEEEERRKEEELMAARKARSAAAAASPPAVASPPQTTPPTLNEPPKSPTGSFNPFHRQQPGASPARSPTTPSFNPFFRPPPVGGAAASTPAAAPAAPAAPAAAAPPPPPPPPPPPAAEPSPRPPIARTNSAPPPDDDWEDAREKEVEETDSSDDDDYANSRNSRSALASALFGNIMNPTGSRPGSAGTPPPAPAPPKAPPAALAKLGGGSVGGGGMSALLSSIQSGAKLRKAETNDRSGPAAGGHVIGDAAPPAHINARPASPITPPRVAEVQAEEDNFVTPTASPQHEEDEFIPRHDNRTSVDWYSGIAGEATHPAASQAEYALEPTHEEEERDVEPPTAQMAAASVSDGPSLDDVDLSKTLHVRTLYDYASTFDGDVPFNENTVLEAHPAKDPNGPWWYGTLPNGNAGWFPSSYVVESIVQPCRALYEYAAGNDEELSFHEGDKLAVVDKSDPDWWKVEKDGAILLVPAAYVEVIG